MYDCPSSITTMVDSLHSALLHSSTELFSIQSQIKQHPHTNPSSILPSTISPSYSLKDAPPSNPPPEPIRHNLTHPRTLPCPPTSTTTNFTNKQTQIQPPCECLPQRRPQIAILAECAGAFVVLLVVMSCLSLRLRLSCMTGVGQGGGGGGGGSGSASSAASDSRVQN